MTDTKEFFCEETSFANRLMSCITDKCRSVRRFAIENNLSPSVVAQYVNGKSEPTRPVLCLMAKILDVDLEWLATGFKQIKKVNTDHKINGCVLEDVIYRVEQAENLYNKKLCPRKKTQIYMILYDSLMEGKEPGPEMLKYMVNLMGDPDDKGEK